VTAAPIRFTGIRGMIARRMQESLATTAQLSFFADADVRPLLAAREAWKINGQRIGIEDLVIHALARVVAAHPLLNAHEVDGEIVPQPRVNVGVAIAIPDALVVPCVFDCDRKSLLDIASERASLVERAPRNRLTVTEMSGGTITITNLGQTRVRHFTPILARPQVAIVGLGRISAAGEMGLSLTVDHRAIDGWPAGRFLTDLCAALEGAHPQP
jgi:pyruvate/2-oxoglutarate dehydrogenase complex dihydrolipoamide acyltransferase (E2) component